MKKRVMVVLLSLIAIATLCFGLTACNFGGNGGGNSSEHTHEYNQEVVDSEYLKSAADCTHKAIYYYSCICGQRGMETFSVGGFAEHTYENNIKYCDNCKRRNPNIPSEGLVYEWSYGKYCVSGMGTCNDKDVVIPSTYDGRVVSGIYYNAFKNCTNLTSIIIPDSIKEICAEAFDGCRALSNVYIGSGLESIGSFAFSDCSSISKIYIADVEQWCGIKGLNNIMGYTRDYKTPVTMYLNEEPVTNLTIPEGVSKIADNAFENCTIESVTIPDSVTHIGSATFENCKKITNLHIPESIKEIGRLAFYGCKTLNNIYYSGELEGWLTISGLSELMGNRADADYIGQVFLYLNGNIVHNLVIPDSVTIIPKYAFFNCGTIESIVMHDGVTNIGYGAFGGCVSLKQITVSSGVNTIEGSTFINCRSLTELVIPEGVSTIESHAFEECTSLKSITLPQSVMVIEHEILSGCSQLETISLPISDWRTPYSTDADKQFPFGILFGTSKYDGGQAITQLTYNVSTDKSSSATYYIPSSLHRICITGGEILDKAFINCCMFTEAVLSSVTGIGDYSFAGCSSLSSISISGGTTTIGDGAFSSCSSLLNIAIPDGVTTIGDSAFKGCTSLTHIAIPDGIACIGNNSFQNCTSLTQITIPDGVMSIGDNSFQNCTSLAQITIPDGTASIGSNSFQNCTSLMRITIPDGLVSIGDYAFEGCSNLLEVSIGKESRLSNIGNGAFYRCIKLQEFLIPENISSYSWGILGGCVKLDTIYYEAVNCTFTNQTNNIGSETDGITIILGRNVQVITDDCFKSLYLKEVNFETGSVCSQIGKNAFKDCVPLESFHVPEHLTKVDAGAFEGCTSLSKLYVSDIANYAGIEFVNVYSIPTYNGNNIYLNDILLKELIIPEGVQKISKYAFYGFNSVTKIIIPSTVKEIGDKSFYNCRNVEQVIYSATSCKSLSSTSSVFDFMGADGSGINLLISNNVTTIPNYLFAPSYEVDYEEIRTEYVPGSGWTYHALFTVTSSQCANITSVIFENDSECTKIGQGAFEACITIKEIMIPEKITEIGSGAFEQLLSLETIRYEAISCNDLTETTKYISNSAFYKAGQRGDGISLIIGSKVEVIPANLFYSDYLAVTAPKITEVAIQNGNLISIGANAFRNCGDIVDIEYTGTTSQWSAIAKGSNWDYGTGNYTIYCTDEDIAKS